MDIPIYFTVFITFVSQASCKGAQEQYTHNCHTVTHQGASRVGMWFFDAECYSIALLQLCMNQTHDLRQKGRKGFLSTQCVGTTQIHIKNLFEGT